MVQKEQMTSPVIGIIGLGIMGGIMAETLLGSGFKVIGFDLEKAACKRLSRAGGEPLKSTQDVVYKADVVITSLATSQALRLVYTQIQEALSKSPKKLILVETSTLPMADKELIAQQLKKPGVSLLDCPISGTAARMKDRAWTIFVSGNKKICQQISPIFKCLSDNAPYVGAYGNGLKMKMIANHGQEKRYYHDIVGCNSRLDSIQAAILNIKLKELDHYIAARRTAADFYNNAFANHPKITTPFVADYCNHVYHQYTLLLEGVDRDGLVNYLAAQKIPSMIYYPVPGHKQKAFESFGVQSFELPITDWLTERVISLPMHTELNEEQLAFITNHVLNYINQ